MRVQKQSKTKPNSKEVIRTIKPARSVELMTERGGSGTGTLDEAEADMKTAASEEQQSRSGKRGGRWMVVISVRTRVIQICPSMVVGCCGLGNRKKRQVRSWLRCDGVHAREILRHYDRYKHVECPKL